MTADSQGRIFISYRRQETAWPARQLYEVLVSRFGAASVFKDVDDIDPGDDFVERITSAVASCDVLLALIGTRWVDMADDQGRRRLDNPEDFVRLELTTALSRGVRVVPILVDGATMPRADQLPPDLVPLTRRQAVEISPVGFNTDRLLATLSATLRPGRPPAPAPDVAAVSPSPPEPDVAAESPSPPEPDVAAVSPSPPEPERSTLPPAGPVPVAVPSTSYGPMAGGTAAPPGPAWGPPTAGGSASAGSGAAGRRTSRRPLVLVAAGVALLALVGTVFVLRPWTGTTAGGTAGPTQSTRPVTAQPGTTRPVTPTDSATPDGTGAPAPPQVLAHRGGLEVHQFETQQAMEAAAAAGYSVETDVRFTSDGVAVLVHDELATKGLDCGGRELRVSTSTWAELKKYCRSKPTAKDPARYPVPRLDATLEGIAAASDSAEVFLEVKTGQTAAQRAQFLAAPAKYGLRERTVVTCRDLAELARIRKADPGTRRMLFVAGKQVPAATLADEGLWGVGLEQGVATRTYVADLRALGLTVMIWVLNDPAQWADFLPLEPDIVMTAYPARFTRWLASQ